MTVRYARMSHSFALAVIVDTELGPVEVFEYLAGPPIFPAKTVSKPARCTEKQRFQPILRRSENSMLPVVQIVLILETEKSSLERFDPRVRPASLSTPWYGAGDEGSLLFANFRSCSVQRRHLGHER